MRQNKLSETVRVSYGLSGRKTPGNLEGSVCVVSVPTRMLPERVSSLWPSLLCLMPFVVTPSPNSGVSVCQSVHEPHLLQVAV